MATAIFFHWKRSRNLSKEWSCIRISTSRSSHICALSLLIGPLESVIISNIFKFNRLILELLEMEFSIQPNSTPVVEFYKQFISVPPNVVEINSVLPGKIIGIDDEENLIIRPESLGVSYSHLKTKMRFVFYLIQICFFLEHIIFTSELKECRIAISEVM